MNPLTGKRYIDAIFENAIKVILKYGTITQSELNRYQSTRQDGSNFDQVIH
jgi:hypothetical protein